MHKHVPSPTQGEPPLALRGSISNTLSQWAPSAAGAAAGEEQVAPPLGLAVNGQQLEQRCARRQLGGRAAARRALVRVGELKVLR